MSDTIESLRRKIDGAGDLGAVVRTMKALAAANISQYERAVISLADYYRAVQWGLGAALAANRATRADTYRRSLTADTPPMADAGRRTGLIIFGSDQGLVGQFNQVLADLIITYTRSHPSGTHPVPLSSGPPSASHSSASPLSTPSHPAPPHPAPPHPVPPVWIVGDRIATHLNDAGLPTPHLFPVPGTVQAITPLITQLLTEIDQHTSTGSVDRVMVFNNRPLAGALYEPVSQCILPVDDLLHRSDAAAQWPSGNIPEIMNKTTDTLQALIGEYIFVSLFKACAESLASENASRLAAMQGAEKNIDELLESLNLSYHHLRQNSIDAELFDVIAGAQASDEK